MATKRKPNGAGSVIRLKDGRWRARITVGKDAEGRQQFKVAYGRTQGEARVKLVEMQAALLKGKLPVTKGRAPILRDYLVDWMEGSRDRVSAKTLTNYRAFLAHVEQLGGIQITALTPEQITRLLQQKMAAGLAPATVRKIRGTLRGALAAAVKRGIVTRNVASDTDPPRLPRREMKVLSLSEVRHLLATCEDSEHRDSNLFAFLVSSGLRVSEALGLRWTDFDAETGWLQVRRQLRTDKGYCLAELKTGSSARDIYLSDQARVALERQRARQVRERLQLGAKWQGEPWDLIFLSPRGAPQDHSAVNLRFHAFMTGHGLPAIRIHDLRHTFATRALQAGVVPTEVAKALGHANPAMTLNIYSRSERTGQEALARRLNEVFS